MAMRFETLSSKQKAAILMVSLGKEASTRIYKHLSEEEIELLTLSITSLERVDSSVAEAVLNEFYEITLAQKYVTEGGMEYARDVLINAVGEERANALLNKLTSSLQVRPFDFIRRADASQIFNFLQNEHPQTIALVLSYVDTDRAALILNSLPQEMQAKVIKRIARMGIVSPDYIREAERVLERKFTSIGYTANVAMGGIDTIVEILNYVDRSTETYILHTIEMDDPELAEEIHNKLFVFEDVMKLPDQSMQKVLKEVDNDTLTIALKGASEDIVAKVYANISKRLQETIKENMEYLGPLRVKDVENAKQNIVNVVRRLEDNGIIEVARGGRDDELIV